jgi:hypothetical protein
VRPSLAALTLALVAVATCSATAPGDQTGRRSVSTDGTVYVTTADVARAGPTPAGSTLAGVRTITFGLKGTVTALSADGPLVAFDEQTKEGCDSFHFWNPLTKASSKGKDGCIDPSTSDTNGDYLTLSGTRALWADFEYGNESYCTSWTSTPAKPTVTDAGLCSGEPDDVVGGIAGEGGSFTVNHWIDCNQRCPGGVTTASGHRVSDVTLTRVDANRSHHEIGSGGTALAVADMDGGRILLVRPDDKLAILSNGGKVLRTIAFQTARVDGAFLQGDDVAIQTSNELLDFSASSGKEKWHRAIPKSDDLVFGGIQSGIAVYTIGRQVVLVRLGNGHSVTFKPGLAPVNARLGTAGLFYGYTEPKDGEVGHVAFVALADIEHATR